MLHLTEGTWENWSGSVRARPRSVHYPETEAELRTVVERADGTLRVAGAGHSFPPVAKSDETFVSLERYTGLVDVDREARRVTVRAGTPLSALTAALADHGLMLENMGDIDDQSVAGALSTGTHGTGTDFGVMSTQAAGMRLVTADGETLELEAGDDRFPFAQVSLGSLGVVSTVTLDVAADYRLRERKFPAPVDDVLANLESYRDHRNFEFWWFPHTDTALVKILEETDAPGRPGRRDAVEERLENLAWEGLCRAGYRVRSAAPLLNRFTAATFSESERVGPAREIYPTTRAVRFNETEYGVPRSDAAAVLEDLRGVVEPHDVMFPVEFRDVAADSIPISPAYGRDSAFVAVHAYHRRDQEGLLRDAEAVFDRHDGRPHWGKHHTKTASDFEALYPRWGEFCEVREELDPEGLFLNDHLRDVFEG
ncbi:FAD-binding protein [Natronomonas salina]|uniref:D-arabinono-1,4-lactone oxidase n=1 Tax=Natronomonas salina TaxID=1710540 RepID=UPI0015B645F1|nr:D-arabinono-1,4-lactone oxidase [Natronomonas salina]QLD89979.1 FAD-binding protein [Natronomonas salina]